MRVTMKKGKQKNNATTRAGRKEELTAYLCLIPAFLGVTLISYLPTLAVFVLSLFDWNGITKPEFIGLANFQRIFTKDIYFWDSIKATVWYAFLAVIGGILTDHSDPLKHEYKRPDIVPLPVLHPVSAAGHRRI